MKKIWITTQSLALCITSLNISLLNLKLGQIGFSIFYGILSVLWFAIWVLEMSLKWEETENENND